MYITEGMTFSGGIQSFFSGKIPVFRKALTRFAGVTAFRYAKEACFSNMVLHDLLPRVFTKECHSPTADYPIH